MFAALREAHRAVRPEGRVVIIIGRESNVRGEAFQNGVIVAALAVASGFALRMRQERKFKNKFGGLIYEDILHFVPCSEPASVSTEAASLIACEALERCLSSKLKPEIATDVKSAIATAPEVRPSPVYTSPLTRTHRLAAAI
jgi:hypothetical protein